MTRNELANKIIELYIKSNKLNAVVIYTKDCFNVFIKHREVLGHRLGANGVMDSLREQFLALPEAPKKKEKQKSSEDIELEIGNGDF